MTSLPAPRDPRLRDTVKAYDVRGLSPEQLDTDVARALGAAFADEVGLQPGDSAVIGHDMRPSSPALVAALSEGIRSRGADVVLLGLASTDMLYAASGEWGLPGVMVTASHNPAQYNGLKLCRAGAKPIGLETGLAAMALAADAMLAEGTPMEPVGTESSRGFLTDYADFVLQRAPVSGRHLKIVVDAGNGMGGHTAPAVLSQLDAEIIELYFELDGTFPHHEANPLDASTLVDLQAAVRAHGADIGLAFDGDADRCFVVDETGAIVEPSAITALVATRYLAQTPGATILYNAISSKAVPEVIAEHGGVGVRTPVGHSLIKAIMAQTGAVFGGEHSGHFYFRDFYLADSGMLAALHVLGALAGDTRTISQILAEFQRYRPSGEINSTVADQNAVIEQIAAAYDANAQDRLDGLTVTADSWWFNVRASNTEPLLRLNVEGDDMATMERIRDEVLALVRAPVG